MLALHAGFSTALTAAEELFDAARRERSGAGYGRTFDFEIVLPADAGVREAFFCQQWLKLRGRPATLVAPFLPTADEARLQAAVARHFGSTLSFDAEALARLEHPSQWAGSRWNCRLTGGAITAARVQAVATALRA